MNRKDIRDLLKARGIKARHVALELGIDAQTINSWGKRGVPPERVPALAESLGCSRAELVPYMSKPAAAGLMAQPGSKASAILMSDLDDLSRADLLAVMRALLDALERSN